MAPDEDKLLARKASKATLIQAFSAVMWSFLGIRKSKDYEADVQQLNPVHVIVVGVVAAALFVIGLLALVKWVVAQS